MKIFEGGIYNGEEEKTLEIRIDNLTADEAYELIKAITERLKEYNVYNFDMSLRKY